MHARLLVALIPLVAGAARAQQPADPEVPRLHAWARGAELDATPQGPAPGTEAERRERGAALFRPLCVRCHGWDARGGGAAGVGMEPAPANLVDRPVKYRSTPADAKPTELDLFRTITRGVHGTGMPAFADWSEADRWALAAYVRSLQPGRDAPPLAIPAPPADLDAKARVEAGAARARTEGCVTCHGAAGARADAFSLGPRFEDRLPARSRDPGELFATIRLGVPGTAMAGRALPDEAIWELVAWVRARLPAPGAARTHPQEQEAIGQVVASCADL